MSANEMPLFAVPGYDAPSEQQDGANTVAITNLEAELEAAGMLKGKYTALMTTLKQTARAVDRELARGKVSVAISNLTRMLLDGIDSLPEPEIETGDDFDLLSEIISSMSREALTGTDG